jgi:hypothetical protein
MSEFLIFLALGLLVGLIPAVLIYRDGRRRWSKGWWRT